MSVQVTYASVTGSRRTVLIQLALPKDPSDAKNLFTIEKNKRMPKRHPVKRYLDTDIPTLSQARPIGIPLYLSPKRMVEADGIEPTTSSLQS